MREPSEEPATRRASGRPAHSSEISSIARESYGPASPAASSGRSGGPQQLFGARRVQRAHRQMMHPCLEVLRQLQRRPGGDEHQAVGAVRHQRPYLLRIRGVVQQHRHREAGQMLVVEVGQPLDVLFLGGAFAEQQLLARCAQPVEQVQQRVPRRQRHLAGRIAAQIHHTRPAELIPQLVGRPHGQRRTSRARLAVQHHHRRPGLRARAGGVHPLGDLRQLRPPARERGVRARKLGEGLLQHGPLAGRRAAVRPAQLRHHPAGVRGDRSPRARLLPGGRAPGGRRGAATGRRRQHPLLVQERPDATHLEGRQPLEPQLLRAAGLPPHARLPVGRRPVSCRQLHDRGGGTRHHHGGSRAQCGAARPCRRPGPCRRRPAPRRPSPPQGWPAPCATAARSAAGGLPRPRPAPGRTRRTPRTRRRPDPPVPPALC